MYAEDKKYLSLGSNLGDRHKNLEKALEQLKLICEVKNLSPIYETKALLPERPDVNDDLFFLNLVVEIDTHLSPHDFLHHIQKIELSFKNNKIQQWGPRYIDIDILTWGELNLQSDKLTIPHPDMLKRPFVLDPLKDLNSDWLEPARQLKNRNSSIMKIYNLTPDSFSDNKIQFNIHSFENQLINDYRAGVSYFDFGAESTRPNALYINEYQEWKRLLPYLNIFKNTFENINIKPKLSIDTYKPSIAKQSIRHGADIINDVSGLKSPQMLDIIKDTGCEYILMHSLDVPANKNNIIKGCPIKTLCNWLEQKLEIFLKHKVPLTNIIFDPGLGFGKNALQSAVIVREIKQFQKYPVRLLVGHSRKSFLNPITPNLFKDRDLETIGVSLKLISKGVDILRIHNSNDHLSAIKGWKYA